MSDEFETVNTSNLNDNYKHSPDKLFSPKSYSGDDDSIRSWQSSMTDDSNNFEHYMDNDKTLSFDTSLESSHSLNYTESCETYKSESAPDSFESSSTLYSRPETPYNKFLERLKDSSCVDIVSAIKGLVVMLPGNMVRSEVATISHNFIDIYTPKLLSLEIFSKLSDDEKAETIECFEKFTMQKLYPQCYRMDPMDAIEDEKLEIQMLCLNWIEPHHLEITTMGDLNILREAQNQLKNLYKYRSPRDKLIIILNFCRLVVYSIQKITNKDVSCDEAFPLLILTIILTNPAELQSCIEFIQYFRHPVRHISEEAYAFTLLVSAVEFIKQIGTSSQLKINTQDFQKKYNQNKAKYQARLSHLKELTLKNNNNNYNGSDDNNNDNNRNKDNNNNNNYNKDNKDNNNNTISTSRSTMSASNNVLDQLKKFNLSTLFKVPLFKQNNNELYEIIESLDYLESYLLDLPLSYQYKDNSLDSPDLINDWRALVAMKKHVTETIASIKNRARNLL